MTSQVYKMSFQRFCDFVGKNPNQIVEDYEQLNDREFRRKYANHIKSWIAYQMRNGLAPNSINSRVGAVKSFFKYNDFPLGFVPAIKLRVIYHNRDITHKEIVLIMDASRPRERAFYAIMAQSGLRPNTICNLKYENIREDFENNIIPCKIEIPQEIAKGKYHSYFTFIGEEAVKYLKSYLIVRSEIKDEEYIFLKEGSKQRINPKSISALFLRTVKKLNEKGKMKLKQKEESKPHDIRLYNLRKFFRKFANQAGFEFVEFWMGHTVNAGQDNHYRPTDVEFYRKLYAEKAMPHLRLETATPTETDKAIINLEEENRELKEQIGKLETMMKKIYSEVFREKIENEEYEKMLEINPEYAEVCNRVIHEREENVRKRKEYLTRNPEARKIQEEQDEEEEQYLMGHLEASENWVEEQVIRLDERRKTLRDLQDKITKAKKIEK